MKSRGKPWAWIIIVIGILYFFLPLLATFIFSLKETNPASFQAYINIFSDNEFMYNFVYSVIWAVSTIFVGIDGMEGFPV